MKTLLATIVAALFITLFFVGGVYCFIYSGGRSGFVYRRFRECLGGFVMVVIVYCFQ